MAEHKRKRASLGIQPEEVRARAAALREEMEGLFRYYREVMAEDAGLGLEMGVAAFAGMSEKGVIACLMEESELPLTKLVEVIHARMGEGDRTVTAAAVKSGVVAIGQRVMYGVPSPDADVLEDDSSSCLWCWETREMKLLPKSAHRLIKIRRTCRRKIHERISGISAMLHLLQKSENNQDCKRGLAKAFEKLDKVLNEADIRMLVEGMLQKNQVVMSGKDGKQDDKAIIRELEKNKRQVEKEKKRIDREHQKEKAKAEKELKRLQEEAEKEERRHEKEEIELKKQLKRQQEEVEKDLRKRQKEEAVLKEQLNIQKQASMMERFLKRSKTSPLNDSEKCSQNLPCSSDSSSQSIPEAVTLSMDSALSLNQEISVADIRKFHFSAWRQLGQSIRSIREHHWGVRQKPKVELYKELKLSNPSKETVQDDELNIQRILDGWMINDNTSPSHNGDKTRPKMRKHVQRKQLLQFDKSYRPAFFGIWPKKSQVVGPRHPLRMDPDLDYDVDSDDEWEEENPGESLSDDDQDDEEILEEDCSKVDEEESEDGFFVPDGYLSEDEGVQVDKMDLDMSIDCVTSSSQQDLDNKVLTEVMRQQKHLHRLTEHALKKNQPFIVLNFMHEKSSHPSTDELSGSRKLEQICLQALKMCAFPGATFPEIVMDDGLDEDQSVNKGCSTPAVNAPAVSDIELPTIVTTIQSFSQSINKVVDSLQQKLPAISKTQLRSKVREISDYVDNRWQVKKEILEKLGMALSPESTKRSTGITTFFSKRCLPPANGSMTPDQISS